MSGSSADATYKKDAPFFVIGAGRSGSTLLRLILAGHSRIAITPETWFIQPLVEKLPLTDPLTPEQVATATGIMTSHYRWPDMELSAEDFRARVATLSSPRLADILNIVYRNYTERHKKPRFGDKTPIYISNVPQLATLFPGAKFIHLIRDGRDVTISNVDYGSSRRTYHGRRFYWANAVHQAVAHRHSKYAADILEVRYEDLVKDTAREVARICDFLGETFEPQMLEYQKRIEIVPERERKIHSKLYKPIQNDALAVWRTKLSGLECFMIEAGLRKELRLMGYELHYSGRMWQPLLGVTGAALRLAAPVLDRALPRLQRLNLLPKKLYM